jgi:hypothetical protein
VTTSSHGGPTESSPEDFKQALATLLRDSFAEGAEIEGTWDIASPLDVVPDWRVVIEETSGAAPPDNEKGFIDE